MTTFNLPMRRWYWNGTIVTKSKLEGRCDFEVSFPLLVRPNKSQRMLKWTDVMRYASKGNPKPSKRIEKTDEEWKRALTPEQYQIARKKGTERAFTGEYCEVHDPGLYACRCCGTLLFDSSLKFESGTGWPSFTQPYEDNAIAYHKDSGYGMVRVEVTCNVCDAHLGHIFPDGPAPSGLGYCINSASIVLAEKAKGYE